MNNARILLLSEFVTEDPDVFEEGLREKLAAGLVGAGITAGALFGGNAMMNQGSSLEQPATQVQQDQNETPDELQATSDLQRKVVERDDGTYYFYYQKARTTNSPQIQQAKMKAFQTKAKHQFMKDTGSNMKGVQHGMSTKDGVSGIWFKM